MNSNDIPLTIQWRVAPAHVVLLPAAKQAPVLPTAGGTPQLHDLVQLADGRYWVVFARHWQPVAQGWALVLWIQPADEPDTQGTAGHTLH